VGVLGCDVWPMFTESGLIYMILHGDCVERRRTDRVIPIHIVLPITYAFIRWSLAAARRQRQRRQRFMYLHLSKESWGENRCEWLQGKRRPIKKFHTLEMDKSPIQ
jgi:hypothetical protein